MTTTDMTVANTIAQQIGPRAFYMMGTQHKLGDARSLTFNIRGCPRYNKIKVSLEPTGTYEVEFLKFRQFTMVRQLLVLNVYAEHLHKTIESATGLALSL